MASSTRIQCSALQLGIVKTLVIKHIARDRQSTGLDIQRNFMQSLSFDKKNIRFLTFRSSTGKLQNSLNMIYIALIVHFLLKLPEMKIYGVMQIFGYSHLTMYDWHFLIRKFYFMVIANNHNVVALTEVRYMLMKLYLDVGENRKKEDYFVVKRWTRKLVSR